MAHQKKCLQWLGHLLSILVTVLSRPIAGLAPRKMSSSSTTLNHQSTQKSASSNDERPQQHIVLVGGGHAHVQVIKALHKKARGDYVKVTLIDPLRCASYSGMVPGCIVGSYDPAETLINLTQLAEWASIDFVNDAVVDVDFDKMQVYVSSTQVPISFDVVSLDIGSVSKDVDAIPGAWEHSVPTRPIHKLIGRLDRAMLEYKDREQRDKESASPRLVVVGGGVAGIELAMTVTTRWQEVFPETTCTLLDSGPLLIPNESASARDKLEQSLRDKRIVVKHNALVKEVHNDCVVLEGSEERLQHSLCIWATGAGASPLTKRLSSKGGLESTEHGWLKVQTTLQSTVHPFVFCAGDCASVQGLERGPPPKAGVYAVRAGPVLIKNLMSYLSGKPLIEYNPQDDYWKLMICGKEDALGFRFGIAIQGQWVWKVKNHIDRQFMQLFDVSELPPPSETSLDTSQYDDVDELLSEIPLNPKDDADLIERTDDAIDYKKAWAILRGMARDDEYRASLIDMLSARSQSV